MLFTNTTSSKVSPNFSLQLFLQIYLPFLEELIFFAPKLTASPLLERARSEEKRRIPWKKEVALKAFIRIPSLLFLFQSLFCAQWTPTASTGLSSQRNRPRPCDINGASPGVASMDAWPRIGRRNFTEFFADIQCLPAPFMRGHVLKSHPLGGSASPFSICLFHRCETRVPRWTPISSGG